MNAHAQQIQARFNGEAKTWNSLYRQPQSPSIYVHNLERRKAHAIDLLGNAPGRTLELGCGAGNVILSAPETNTAFGSDFSLAMLRQARQNANGRAGAFPLLAANALSPPIESGVFDNILCLGVLEYIPNYPRVLSECHRVLASGGQFIVSVPNGKSPFIRTDDLVFGIKRTAVQAIPAGLRNRIKTRLLGRRDKPYFNHKKQRFDPQAFSKKLETTGFQISEIRYHTFGFGLLNGLNLNVQLSECLEVYTHHHTTLEKSGWTCILKATKP